MSDTNDDIRIEVTDFGLGLLVKALNNETPIHFVSLQFGNGDAPEDFHKLTGLVNPLLECGITAIERWDNYVQLTTVFDNSDIEDGFKMSEIGAFAEDADLGKGLFAYIHQGLLAEPVLPSTAQKLLENNISVQIIVDSAVNVTASLKSMAYVSRAEFEDHINNFNNPHKVTKQDVGLGNVPNVDPNDAVIKFKASEAEDNIESGDKISTAFGKIFTAIKKLYEHIADKKNPHGLSALDIGAAGADHSHKAADITSGTLSAIRGGTGKSSWTSNRILFASSTTELSQIAPPSEFGVLVQEASGQPRFMAFSSLELFASGTEAPSNKNILWIDTTPITGGLKYHNGSAWVHVPVAYSE